MDTLEAVPDCEDGGGGGGERARGRDAAVPLFELDIGLGHNWGYLEATEVRIARARVCMFRHKQRGRWAVRRCSTPRTSAA